MQVGDGLQHTRRGQSFVPTHVPGLLAVLPMQSPGTVSVLCLRQCLVHTARADSSPSRKYDQQILSPNGVRHKQPASPGVLGEHEPVKLRCAHCRTGD